MSLLHLVVPGLLGPLPAGTPRPELPSLPNLERLLARADRQSMQGEGWEGLVLEIVGVPPGDGGQWPIGALSLLGEGLEPGEACWLAVEPIHLYADLNRLLVAGAQTCRPGVEETAELVGLFNRHFGDQGLHLTAPDPARWYLRADPGPAITTRSLGDLADRSPDRLLPGGEQGGAWRSLMNETQMLFHGAATNAERESRGLATINGIWPYGPGRLPRDLSPGVGALFGAGPLLSGLSRAAELPLAALPERAEAMLGADRDCLALYDDLLSPLLEGELQAWARELERLDRWLSGASGKGALCLYACRGDKRVINRGPDWRFWRARRPLMHWIESC